MLNEIENTNKILYSTKSSSRNNNTNNYLNEKSASIQARTYKHVVVVKNYSFVRIHLPLTLARSLFLALTSVDPENISSVCTMYV